MGTKYTSQTITGYNVTPPADDGTEVESNKGYWATIKTKLGDPTKTYADDINSAMATYADLGPITKSAIYTTTTADHLKTIECTGTFTLTLGASASMGAGYTVTVKNTGTGIITVDGSGAETIDGQANITLDPLQGVTAQVDSTGTEYLNIAQKDAQFPTPETTAGSANTYTVTTGETAYLTDKLYTVQINATNTGASTIDFDSLGAKNIKMVDGSDPYAGALYAGQVTNFVYDGTNMVITSATPYLPVSSVAQDMIQSSAVGQAELKTSSSTVSCSASNNYCITGVLPGGQFGFRLQHYGSLVSVTLGGYGRDQFSNGPTSWSSPIVRFHNSTAPTGTGYARELYIDASEPYDMGDGLISAFIFVELDKMTGEVLKTYVSPAAPWHYNGPTDIRAKYYRKDGMGCRLVKESEFKTVVHGLDIPAMVRNPKTREEALSILANKDLVELEIRQEIKNRDMGLIPHPYIDGIGNNSVIVMLDPISDFVLSLRELNDIGDNISALIHDKYITIDNTPLDRACPLGVTVVSASWKNSG